MPEKQIFKTTCESLEYSDRKLGDQITTPYHATYNRPISFGILKLLFLGTPDCCARYYFLRNLFVGLSLREKCSNTEFFLVHIFPHLDWMRENTDQRKLRIWTLHAVCIFFVTFLRGLVKHIENKTQSARSKFAALKNFMILTVSLTKAEQNI